MNTNKIERERRRNLKIKMMNECKTRALEVLEKVSKNELKLEDAKVKLTEELDKLPTIPLMSVKYVKLEVTDDESKKEIVNQLTKG